MAAVDRASLPRRRAPRKRHAASASRILAGGLSVATTFGLTAHWGASAAQSAAALDSVGVDVASATGTAPEPVQRVVIVRRIIREVYADPVPGASAGAAADASTGSAGTAPAPAATPSPQAPAPAPAPAPTPSLPSAALAPPPVAAAPAPATSSNGS